MEIKNLHEIVESSKKPRINKVVLPGKGDEEIAVYGIPNNTGVVSYGKMRSIAGEGAQTPIRSRRKVK